MAGGCSPCHLQQQESLNLDLRPHLRSPDIVNMVPTVLVPSLQSETAALNWCAFALK